MNKTFSAKLLLLFVIFFMGFNAQSQTISLAGLIKMTSLSADEMDKTLKKSYTYANKTTSDSLITWNCTTLGYGGNAFYTYTRSVSSWHTTIIGLSMTYKNVYERLEQEAKAMKLKEDSGIYENDKILISFTYKEESGKYHYLLDIEAK